MSLFTQDVARQSIKMGNIVHARRAATASTSNPAVSRRYMAAEQTPNTIPLARGLSAGNPVRPDFGGGAPLSRRNPNYMDCVDGLVGRMHPIHHRQTRKTDCQRV